MSRSSAAHSFALEDPAPRGEPIVLVEYADTDASGEARLIAEGAIRPGEPRVRVLSVFDTSSALRRHIWNRDPRCVECGVRTPSPDSAGYLSMPDEGVAVACRGACFPRAVARFNPSLNQDLARERDEALAELVPDLRLVPDVPEDC